MFSKFFKGSKNSKVQELPLAQLDAKGGNFIIQNSADSETQLVISRGDDNSISASEWDGEFSSDKLFTIEQSTDNGKDWIVSAYNTTPKLQWVVIVDDANIELKSYPNKNEEERLRPPLLKWRFCFTEVGEGYKTYRIQNREDMEEYGNRCFSLVNSNGHRQLRLTEKDDADPTQLWVLHRR